MSCAAPLDTSSVAFSSAMRPPHSHAHRGVDVPSAVAHAVLLGQRERRAPSADRAGMIVTLCSGSASLSRDCSTAWPASWYAVARRVLASSITRLRLGPAEAHLVAGLLEVVISTASLPASVALIAASLMIAARSAPLNIGVPRASRSGRRRGHLHLLGVDLQDLERPFTSGSGTRSAGRSARAGQRGSSTSARFVAAMTMTWSEFEAVHLDEDRVERLLALVVAAG
jgi:hypothetical protein